MGFFSWIFAPINPKYYKQRKRRTGKAPLFDVRLMTGNDIVRGDTSVIEPTSYALDKKKKK